MKYTTKKIYLAVIASLVCASTCVRATDLPKTADLLPPETVLLLDIDSFSRLKTQLEKTNLYKLYNDPAMRAFVENTKTKLQEQVRKLDENDIFRTFFNANLLPQGRVAVALVLNEQTKDANVPPLVLMTQWGPKIDKVKQAVKTLLEKNTELGGHQKKSENYRGVTIGIAVDEDGTPFNHCFVDDCLMVSSNVELLKFVIAHIKGAASPTLARDGDYAATMKAVGPYHDIDLYVNIKQMVKMVLAEDTTDKTQAAMANLGFDNVASLGCSIGIARSPGISCQGKTLLKINGARKGICKMLELESAPLKSPRFIPASACSATFFNLDIKKAFSQLANILTGFSPQAAAVLYMPLLPAGPQGEPQVQLKRDIIDHLGEQLIFARSINKPFSADSAPAETFFALAANNAKALEKSLSLLHSRLIAPNNPDAKRQLLGHTIYIITLPGLNFFPGARTPLQNPAPSTTPQMPRFAFTITDTHLIFGLESTVERAIRLLASPGAPSMASAKWFSTAKAAVPSVVGMANLQDNTALGELLWWLMKQGKLPLGLKSPTGKGSSAPINFHSFQPGELFNFSLLPEFDTVRRYFGVSAAYGISRPDGFFFEFKYLNSSQTAD